MTVGKRNKICIVTSASISHNPRVVKEADALQNAGFQVRVISTLHDSSLRDWQTTMMKNRSWRLDTIDWGLATASMKFRRIKTALRQRLFANLALRIGFKSKIPELAYCRLYSEMLARAIAERADLYIAHNPQALPVACRAAELVNAKVAFDSEDYHIGEFDQSEENTLAYRLTANLESKYLGRCEYVTSPSDGICDAIMHRYKVKRVLTVRNVFPLAERGALNNKNEDRRGKALSLYWYSQVIGLNRGVQDAIKAAVLLSEPVQIHIRGEETEEIKRELSSLLNGNETKVSLFFHPQVQPEELLSRTAEHDIGLALERNDSENRRLTVTNKFYFYALAGLAIGATNTKGQETEMERHPEIGFTYKSGAHTDLAKHLQRYIDDPDLLRRTKSASLAAAEKEWNWERESQRLISLVESVF